MTNQGFTKEFLSQIINLKNSYLLSLATVDLLSHDDVITILKEDSFRTGGFLFEFSHISNLIKKSKIEKNKDFEILILEYLMFSTRSLFISLYEGFKDDEIRYKEVRELDWFIFLANIRHSIAHGMNAMWKINKYGKSEIFYLRKNDNVKIIIDDNWDNTPMKFNQIGGWATPIDLILFLESEVGKLVK